MAWELLFNSDIGLMSLGVIVVTIIIGYVMGKMFSNNIKKDARNAGK